MARSRSRADNNDTIDMAVLGGLKDEEALKAYEVVHFQPFDPVHKRTEAAVKAKDGKTFKVTKGAPQVILALAANAGQVKAAVEGHLTIFLTRTRGPFWSIRPAKTLWIAVLGTQIVATLIGVYGLFMTPLGWGWALFVWGYALAWFLLNDRVKLLGYRIFDPVEAEPKPEAKR